MGSDTRSVNSNQAIVAARAMEVSSLARQKVQKAKEVVPGK